MLYRRSEAKAFGRKNLRGIWAAIPFPFTKAGELDEKGLRRDIRRYVDELKLDGFFCGGLVGEFWALTMEERQRGHRIVVEEVAGKTQTMPHTGALSLRDTIALTRHAQEIVRRIHGEVTKIVALPETKKLLEDNSLHPIGSSPEEFADFIKKDIVRQAEIVRMIGFEPQ